MSPSISSNSSSLSLCWARSVSSVSFGVGNPSSTLNFPLRNGADEFTEKPKTGSSQASSDTSSQRRKFVFGTPTSQAPTEEAFSDAASEINAASEQLGMSAVRDAEGRPVWMRSGSVAGLPDSPYIGGSERNSSRGSKGGSGSTGWIMCEDCGPRQSSLDRRRSLQLKLGGKIAGDRTIRTDGRADEIFSLSRALSSTPPEQKVPWELPRRFSTGSKFKEGFPPPRSATPMQWIRRKTKSHEKAAKNREEREAENSMFGPPPLPKLRKKKHRRRLPPITIPADDRRLKELSPRTNPLTATSLPGNEAPVSASSGDSMAAQHHTRPHSRINGFRSSLSTVRRRFSTTFSLSNTPPSPKHSNDTSVSAVQFPPSRPSTPPPRGNPMQLEYLTTEARGIMTPEELPVFSSTNLGPQKLPRSIEMGYFDRLDMIQSQPPLSVPGELSLVLEPSEQPTIPPPVHSPLQAYPDIASVAPFLVQDLECNRPAALSPAPLAPAFVRAQTARTALSATASKIRRMSEAAKTQASRRKLSDVSEVSFVHHHDGGKKLQLAELVSSQTVNKSRWSIVSWIRQSKEDEDARVPPTPPQKPIEVELEERRREKRDTGVIGLATPGQSSESSGYSISYAAASRDIAGLEKKPKGKPRSLGQEMFIGLGGSAPQD